MVEDNGDPQKNPAGQPATGWAAPIDHLSVITSPKGALNMNVEGRKVVGPLQGFGPLWQKTYWVRMSGSQATPEEVVQTWKAKLPVLMPRDSRFYPTLSNIEPGEVVLIDATLPGLPGGLPVSTGVLVLYVDEVSFTVMTPEGHPESGFNTFSAYQQDQVTVAQVQSLGRTNDPMFEFGYRFMGGHAAQEKIWMTVLTNLATEFNVRGQVQMQKTCLDPRLQWSEARNLRHNAILHTMAAMPGRAIKRAFARPG